MIGEWVVGLLSPGVAARTRRQTRSFGSCLLPRAACLLPRAACLLPPAPCLHVLFVLRHEHEVDVAGIVKLLSAKLAHRNDRKCGPRSEALGKLACRDLHRLLNA